MTELCAIVLAAGAGTRLRPLTLLRPKALCPVGNRPLLDRALELVASVGLAAALCSMACAEVELLVFSSGNF
jgi:MurNAc alpha-1-phosphate uridylyltransferase